MATADLNILGAFLIAAEERSFTKAVKRLGVSPSAISHAIRGVEEGLGVRLRPALTDLEDALDKLSGLRGKPAGHVRLVAPRLAAMTVLAPKLKKFANDHPDVVLDITADESRMDIVAGGFDAGIHFGEYIQKFSGTSRPLTKSGQSRHRCALNY